LRGVTLFAYPVDWVRNLSRSGYVNRMSAWDDDDWTGEPPEGRHSRSQANPGFWTQNRAPLSITGAGIGIAIIILLIVLLL
jgi:hypothetical protein